MLKTTLVLVIEHSKAIPELTDIAAGRIYTLDGVEDVTALAGHLPEVDESTAMQGGRWVSADDIERMVGELVAKATGEAFRPTKMVDGYRIIAAALASSEAA